MPDLKEYMEFAVEKTVELLAIDSPTGYTEEAAHWVAEEFRALGAQVTRTRKGSVLVDLGGRDAENAVLLVSGIIDAREQDVLLAAEKHGFTVKEKQYKDNWCAFALI